MLFTAGMRRLAILALGLGAACSTPLGPDGIQLDNSSGKDDSVAIRVKLTEGNQVVGFTIGCDQVQGCEGHIGVTLKTPEPCALFPDDPRCGVARTQPLGREVLSTEIISTTEGARVVPLRIETGDGDQWTKSVAAAFTANGNEEVEVTLTKAAGTPDLTIEVRAEWKPKADPNAAISELTAFLGTVSGLTYQEIGTASAGYRAFLLQYEQPLDHANPTAGTFKQQIVLHHRDKAAPMILYTSGYALFAQDDMSELGAAMQANQLNTEQRWFGQSKPADVTPESWKLVTIEQAAKDHHRIVTALEPFYSGKWLSTGHSKGGMTSIFHRRFFPTDIDATVAYVAPISFADPDPRYAPFLDQIGEEQCRTNIRNIQKKALEMLDQLVPLAQAAHDPSSTFERTGGLASAIEKDITALEWGYWQYYTAAECAPFATVPADANTMFNLLAQYAGVGAPDTAFEDDRFLAYQYQAATQLGQQGFATAHLAGLLKYDSIEIDAAPRGTMPVHDRSAMDDVQSWVKTQASQLLFVYGGSDPWTGGAYELGTQPATLELVAPGMSHAAMLKDLTPADRETALATLEQWMGTRPTITPGPRRAPMPWMR